MLIKNNIKSNRRKKWVVVNQLSILFLYMEIFWSYSSDMVNFVEK